MMTDVTTVVWGSAGAAGAVGAGEGLGAVGDVAIDV